MTKKKGHQKKKVHRGDPEEESNDALEYYDTKKKSRRSSQGKRNSEEESNDALEYYDPKKRASRSPEDEGNDALEYYDAKKTRSSDEEVSTSLPAAESVRAPPPPLLAYNRPIAVESRPGAFRMQPGAAATPTSDALASVSSHSHGGYSMVVVPQAYLVHGDEAQVSVAPEPPKELVFASPLPQSPPKTLLDLEQPAVAGDRVEAANNRGSRSDDKGKGISAATKGDSNNFVLVLNKRWLLLAGLVGCLVISIIVGGISYALLESGGGSGISPSKNSNNGDVISSNGGNDKPPRDNSSKDDDRSNSNSLRLRH